MSHPDEKRAAVRAWLKAYVHRHVPVDPDLMVPEAVAAFDLADEITAPDHWWWQELEAAMHVAAALARGRSLMIAEGMPVNPNDAPFAVVCPGCARPIIVEALAAFSGREWGRWVMQENGGRPYFLDPRTFANRCPVTATDCPFCGAQIRIALAVFVVGVPQGTSGRTIGHAGGVGMRPAGVAPEQPVVPVRQPPEAPPAPNMFSRGRDAHPVAGTPAVADDASEVDDDGAA